LSGAYRFV